MKVHSNYENKAKGRKAVLQRFEAKHKGIDITLVLAVCTPVMARVHTMVPQSAEIAFCDSTAGLDIRYNNSPNLQVEYHLGVLLLLERVSQPFQQH